MNRIIRAAWVQIVASLLIGLIAGSLITRWHYKALYKDYVKPKPCGGINYYDKTGKVLLYKQSGCSG